MDSFPEPSNTLSDAADLLPLYLDYYRGVIRRKLNGLPQDQLRQSRLPSGWTPLGLLKHLTYMERRWFRWGFMAEPIENPWGPRGEDSDWVLEPGETYQSLLSDFQIENKRSRDIVAGASLTDIARIGGRFNPPETESPTLIWILFHVLQEYARHAGHLDIVRELIDNTVGE